MSNPARIAAFKSKTRALIHTLKLEPDEVVGLGITLATSYASTAGLAGNALHEILDRAVADTAAAKAHTQVGRVS